MPSSAKSRYFIISAIEQKCRKRDLDQCKDMGNIWNTASQNFVNIKILWRGSLNCGWWGCAFRVSELVGQGGVEECSFLKSSRVMLVLLLRLWHTLWWPQVLRKREEYKESSWCMFTDALYCWELCETLTHWARAFFLLATLLIVRWLCTGHMAYPECFLHLSKYRVGFVLSVIGFCDSVLLPF